jgi:WD40 repeat protein
VNTNSIATLTFNVDGHLLALGSFDGIINVWNLKAPLAT